METCPLGAGYACNECDSVEYSCHPSHNRRAKNARDRVDKLLDNISYALRQPACDKKTARISLEEVQADLEEIRELMK